MIFKQIHSLPTNPNWGKIAFLTIVVIGTGFIVYQIVKSYKFNVQPISPKKDNKTD